MSRPENQRWIKRPPRPSRPAGPPPRPKPKALHLGIAAVVGAALGIVGAAVGVLSGAREGVPGLLAGAGLFGGGLLAWRAFGFTVQDLRDYFR